MSPRQRSILYKMKHAKSDYLMNETVKTINKLILKREKDVQDIADAARKKNTPLANLSEIKSMTFTTIHPKILPKLLRTRVLSLKKSRRNIFSNL